MARLRSGTRKVVKPISAALIDALTPGAGGSVTPGKRKAKAVRPTQPAPTRTMPRALVKRAASSTTTT